MLRPLLVATLFLATPAAALEPITQEARFVQMIDGKVLSRFGIRLEVGADGTIAGRGFGRKVSGAWEWRDGYFCRTLDWGATELGYNCQAIMADGSTIRFISDRGTGESADFSLR